MKWTDVQMFRWTSEPHLSIIIFFLFLEDFCNFVVRQEYLSLGHSLTGEAVTPMVLHTHKRGYLQEPRGWFGFASRCVWTDTQIKPALIEMDTRIGTFSNPHNLVPISSKTAATFTHARVEMRAHTPLCRLSRILFNSFRMVHWWRLSLPPRTL